MGCPDANLIAAFVGGTLDPVLGQELARHLDGCTACDELVAWSLRAAEASPTAARPVRFATAEISARAIGSSVATSCSS